MLTGTPQQTQVSIHATSDPMTNFHVTQKRTPRPRQECPYESTTSITVTLQLWDISRYIADAFCWHYLSIYYSTILETRIITFGMEMTYRGSQKCLKLKCITINEGSIWLNLQCSISVVSVGGGHSAISGKLYWNNGIPIVYATTVSPLMALLEYSWHAIFCPVLHMYLTALLNIV